MIQKRTKLLPSLLVLPFAILGLLALFISSNSLENEDKLHTASIQENYQIFSLSVPEVMSFADMAVPLKEPEVAERLDRELHANTYFHSNTILYFKRANRWFPVIEPILEKNGIPDDFKYLALIESGLQNVVSPAGATGFWQFLKKTGQEYGLEINDEVDERYHLEKATEAACKYLNDAYEKYEDWALVAASYNTGMGRISRALERQKTDNYYDLLLNNETGRYVFRIVAVKEIFMNPEDYGFQIRSKDLYEPLNFKEVQLDSSITDFAGFAKENQISYKILKYFNPWLRQTYLKNPSKKKYALKIPSDPEYLLDPQ